MASHKKVLLRITAEQKAKLEALAEGEGTSMTKVLSKLVDDVRVEPTVINRPALRFATNANTHGDRQANHAGVLST